MGENKPYKHLPVRQLIRFSNYSLCITLPKEFIDILSWQQGDQIAFELNLKDKCLILNKRITQSKPSLSTNPPKPKEPALLPPPNSTPAPQPTVTSQPVTQGTININHDDLTPLPPLN